MEAFNGEPNVREQRLAAYAERYITVTPSESMKGLRLESGGEIHRDDGTIIGLAPGDWVVELPDGSLGRISSQIFTDSFKAEGKDEQLFAARQQVGLEKPAELLPEELPPSPESIKEAVQRAHEETNARVQEWADAAFKGELISAEERDRMVDINELPEGLTVKEGADGWLLSREGGKDVGSLGDAKPTEEPTDLRDLTTAELRQMLDERGIPHKATGTKKADLIELLEDYAPPQVIVGAETAETAAREPQAPEWGHEPGDAPAEGRELEDTPQVNPNPAADEEPGVGATEEFNDEV